MLLFLGIYNKGSRQFVFITVYIGLPPVYYFKQLAPPPSLALLVRGGTSLGVAALNQRLEATGGARWWREEAPGTWSSPGTQEPGPGAQVEALGEEEEELKEEEE